tara:strand:+ start:529 stop:1071 length:543 start_codon:yes stop_codon:yes gene_type:complete
MKYFYIAIFLNISSQILAETNPPKVTTQQFQNWTYQCVESKKKKTCDVSQSIRIQNSQINFSIIYSKFLNSSKETKKNLTIIAPFGVDLNSQLVLRFDKGEQINLKWSTCEQIGCLVLLTNNTKDEKLVSIYNKVYGLLNKSNGLEIIVRALSGNQPIAIKSNLKGFGKAAEKLNSETIS